MPPEILKTLPGYDPDVQKNRTDARRIMERLGYGPGDGSRSRCRCATSRSSETLP